jgi:hypothetical protein
MKAIETEMPLAEMLKKRAEIYKKLGGSPTNQWTDLYGMNFYDDIPKGTIIVIKSVRSQNICGVGIFSAKNKLRMTPMYLRDSYYDASKPGDVLDIYIYNEKTNTMNLCVCSYYNRHTERYFGVLRQEKFYTNFEIKSLDVIGDEDIKF